MDPPLCEADVFHAAKLQNQSADGVAATEAALCIDNDQDKDLRDDAAEPDQRPGKQGSMQEQADPQQQYLSVHLLGSCIGQCSYQNCRPYQEVRPAAAERCNRE